MSGRIAADALIGCFETMLRERWTYAYGAAREGCVDCSGAFVYAFKKLGGSAIEHGSNAIARKRVGAMMPVDCARPGWAAFKWKAAGEPEKYTDGKGNYFHIGLVDGTGRYVLNAKGAESGFSRDALSGWSFAAPLNDVNYEEMKWMETLYRARVTTRSGPLNLRDRPNGAVIGKIPRGEVVDVLSDEEEWWAVDYRGARGYASSDYLERILSGAAGEVRIVLEDSEGNTFCPVGGWTVRVYDEEETD